MLDFVALDFETANANRASVCAVGMARVQDGVITAEEGWLIQPPNNDGFNPINVRIHGITAQQVIGAPTWSESLERILDFVSDYPVVAHNAQFDMGIIRAACLESGRQWPDLKYFCSLGLSRSVLQLPSYRLPWVATALNLPSFNHHDATADARTAALVTVLIADRLGATTVDALLDSARTRPGFLGAEGWHGVRSGATKPCAPAGVINTNGPLAHESVCFTGALQRFSRPEARAEVLRNGGTFTTVPGRKTTLLVVGDLDPSTFRPGARFSSKMQKAMDANAGGQRIEILTEDDFLERLEIDEGEAPPGIKPPAFRGLSLPDHVVVQSWTLNGAAMEYWAWFDAVLQSPFGRATFETPCLRCGLPIPRGTHWKPRDRGVCTECSRRMIRAARRLWEREELGPAKAEDGALAPPAGR